MEVSLKALKTQSYYTYLNRDNQLVEETVSANCVPAKGVSDAVQRGANCLLIFDIPPLSLRPTLQIAVRTRM